MRAHMLSLFADMPPAGHASRMTRPDASRHLRRTDELQCHKTLEPAIVDHVNLHFHADPACETSVVKRLNLKRKGSVLAFEAIAHFHGHRVQGDVAVMGSFDPATGTFQVKRLEERSVSRRGTARKTSLLGAAKQFARKTALFLHP